jgi:5-methylcytosine-specific restriction endonuclease McrA
MLSKLEKETKILESQLKKIRAFNSIKKLLSFGILNSDEKVRDFEDFLQKHILLERNFRAAIDSCSNLDKEWEEVENIRGIRISKNTFADFKATNAEGYPQDWDDLRMEILQRDDFKCQEGDERCSGPLQIHHIIPLSRGGSNNPENLVTLCLYHHSLKHEHMRMGEYGYLRS